MDGIDEIRRRNLLLLIARFGSQRRFCDAAKIKNAAQVSQWVNRSPRFGTGKPRAMSGESARHIEAELGLSSNWLDHPQTEQTMPRRDHLSERALALARLFEDLDPKQQDLAFTVVDAMAKSRVTAERAGTR